MFANFSRFMNDGGVSGMGLVDGAVFGLFMLIAVVWTLYWKFHALWYAAKHDHKWWFIAMLIVNSLGILEILYLYVLSKKMGSMEIPTHDEKNVPMVK